MSGNYDYPANVSIDSISICGVPNEPERINISGQSNLILAYNAAAQVDTVSASVPLTRRTEDLIVARWLKGEASWPTGNPNEVTLSVDLILKITSHRPSFLYDSRLIVAP